MSVFVTGASRRASLTVTRSLGQKGISVILGDYAWGGVSFFSKYCSGKVIYPSPVTSPSKFTDTLLAYIKEHNVEVLLPMHDFELIPVLERKKEFEKYVGLPFVDIETMRKTIDKTQTVSIASDLNIPVPKTYCINSLDDLHDIAESCKLPLVIKPKSQSIFGAINKSIHITSDNYVFAKEDIYNKYVRIHAISPFPMIQEYVRGYGAGVEVLLNRGSERAVFIHKRLREYPITGGPSTFRESIHNPVLVDYALKILKKLEWHGLAMVEFKIKPDGTPVFMEVNGRFWGSIALPFHAGIDFPYLLYRMAVEGDIEPAPDYPDGVKCRWIVPGDLLWLISAIRENKAIGDFFSFRGMYFDYLTRDDPLPLIGACTTACRHLVDFMTRKRTIHGDWVQ